MKNALTRTGFGFDSHIFGVKGALKLGGLTFSDCPRLVGHSDGDALIHALIDALLGAACLGDIGDFFPDTSKRTKGISSTLLLKSILKKVTATGFHCIHVDVTVVAEKPRMSPVKKKMKLNLSRLLKLSPANINIKAKTPEGLTWFQSSGGIAVWVLATLTSTDERNSL